MSLPLSFSSFSLILFSILLLIYSCPADSLPLRVAFTYHRELWHRCIKGEIDARQDGKRCSDTQYTGKINDNGRGIIALECIPSFIHHLARESPPFCRWLIIYYESLVFRLTVAVPREKCVFSLPSKMYRASINYNIWSRLTYSSRVYPQVELWLIRHGRSNEEIKWIEERRSTCYDFTRRHLEVRQYEAGENEKWSAGKWINYNYGEKRSVCWQPQIRNDPLNHQTAIDLRFLIGSLVPPYYNS